MGKMCVTIQIKPLQQYFYMVLFIQYVALFSRLIGRRSSVIFRLSELAHRVEECAQKEEEEEEELPEVRPFIISTYKFSRVISIHYLTELVERI